MFTVLKHPAPTRSPKNVQTQFSRLCSRSCLCTTSTDDLGRLQSSAIEPCSASKTRGRRTLMRRYDPANVTKRGRKKNISTIFHIVPNVPELARRYEHRRHGTSRVRSIHGRVHKGEDSKGRYDPATVKVQNVAGRKKIWAIFQNIPNRARCRSCKMEKGSKKSFHNLPSIASETVSARSYEHRRPRTSPH